MSHATIRSGAVGGGLARFLAYATLLHATIGELAGQKKRKLDADATVAAILAASAGVMLLASGATPSEPTRFLLLLAFAPDLLIEISHFFSSILGLVLLLLAFGLRARLGAAWWAALIVLGASAVLAMFKGLNWEETAMLLVCLFLILPF